MPTEHFRRVRKFMQLAGQETPDKVTKDPGIDVRLLRARLILEEALETIKALGFEPLLDDRAGRSGEYLDLEFGKIALKSRKGVDFEGVIDGCCDLRVVATGTLIAFGVEDELVQREVDETNLRKFGPGSYRREDGKWMKPSGWTPPDFTRALEDNNPCG